MDRILCAFNRSVRKVVEILGADPLAISEKHASNENYSFFKIRFAG